MLMWIIVVHFSVLYSIWLYEHSKIYLFHCSWTLRWFAILWNGTMKILVTVFWCMCASKSRIAELQGMFMFNFILCFVVRILSLQRCPCSNPRNLWMLPNLAKGTLHVGFLRTLRWRDYPELSELPHKGP